MKKAISVFIAVLMALCVMPFAAYADNDPDAVYRFHETISVFGVVYDDGMGKTYYFNNSAEPFEVVADEIGTEDDVINYQLSPTAQTLTNRVTNWANSLGVTAKNKKLTSMVEGSPAPCFGRSSDDNPDARYETITDAKYLETITRYDNATVRLEGHVSNILPELAATVTGIAANAAVGSTAVTTEDTNYTVELIGWYDCESPFDIVKGEELSADTALVGGKTYVVGVKFTANDGFTIIKSPDVTINGEEGKIGGYSGSARMYYVPVTVSDAEPEPVLTGWQYIDGAWYFYNESGEKHTGWLLDGGKWYYLKSDGVMATGWVKSGSSWYFMSKSGAMATGWVKSGNDWYFMKSNGAMATGWVKSGSKWYFMKSSGAMATGWVKSSGKWYYMDASGAMLANTSKKINGKTYKFNGSGVCTNP